MTPDVLAARNRANSLSRHRGPNHPSVREARAYLAELRLREQITSADLPAAARSRLAALLLAGAA
jgi:hypothetical protein